MSALNLRLPESLPQLADVAEPDGVSINHRSVQPSPRRWLLMTEEPGGRARCPAKVRC